MGLIPVENAAKVTIITVPISMAKLLNLTKSMRRVRNSTLNCFLGLFFQHLRHDEATGPARQNGRFRSGVHQSGVSSRQALNGGRFESHRTGATPGEPFNETATRLLLGTQKNLPAQRVLLAYRSKLFEKIPSGVTGRHAQSG
jgi:hypothetical protein